VVTVVGFDFRFVDCDVDCVGDLWCSIVVLCCVLLRVGFWLWVEFEFEFVVDEFVEW